MVIKNLKKVLVIGAGGTGSILIPQLARYLYSQKFTGKLVIADGDKYSESNLDRQSFNPSKIGTNKAEYQNMVIVSQLPGLQENVSFLDKYLSKADVTELVGEDTIVINCADNNAIRKYVEDRVGQLSNAAHICCGNELRHGQVQVYLRRNGKDMTPTIFTDAPAFNSEKDDRSAMDCETLAALPSGGQLIASNMMCAALALNYFLQLTFGSKMNRNGEYITAGFTGFDVFTNITQQKSKVPFSNEED